MVDVRERLRVRVRQAGAALGLLLLAASAAYGADLFGMRTRLVGSAPPAPRPPAVSRVAEDAPAATATPEATRVRSYPWWQAVGTFEGTGATTTPAFTIDDGALQWRVRWRCESGRLTAAAPDHRDPLVDADCPEGDAGYSTQQGRMRLQVTADGPWRLVVEQQIDVPLVEPRLPVMLADGAVAAGTFYDIDQTGRGRVVVHRLGDGRYALRLEEFFVTPNVDLEIRLSPLQAPRTTAEYLSADAVRVAVLDATAGSMNFTVPPDIDPTGYRSVVIWCPPIDSAYAAASLTPPDG